jgi:protein-tyrosine phosphatase
MDLVFRHSSGGRLYQGDKKDSLDVVALDTTGIKTVVFAAYENNEKHLPDRFDVIRARLDDAFFMSREDEREYYRCADKVSDILLLYLANGFNVLSTCRAGRNRSGLMSGFTLVKLGFSPEQAIHMIRRARGHLALCNPAFTRLIRNFGRRRAQGAVA